MGLNYLQVKYDLYHGNSWKLINGENTGISQAGCYNAVHSTEIVWNMPFDFIFDSNNLLGWPKMTITIYGPDLFGRSVIIAYGVFHIPSESG